VAVTGGYMTAHALARRSDLFAAGVDMHGVHNWNTEIPTFMPEYDSLRLPQIGQLAYRSSPMNYIDGWRSPVLLIHRDDDANVNFRESETLARALRQKGIDFEQLIIPDEVHLFLRYDSWSKAYTRAAAFLERRVFKK
jgi:dipeptidyl aminopeptidase/acylaminoacyl peptidase